MTNRDLQWRKTAADCDLFEHVNQTVERLRDHAKFAQEVVNGSMSPVHVQVLLDALAKSVDELILRTDGRELMDATRPERPEPPALPEVADPLLELLKDIDAAEAAGEVTEEGGVILRPSKPITPDAALPACVCNSADGGNWPCACN